LYEEDEPGMGKHEAGSGEPQLICLPGLRKEASFDALNN
jgi:hypothetical protein